MDDERGTNGWAPLYPHSSRRAVSYTLKYCRCQGRNWPLREFQEYGYGALNERITYHEVDLIGDFKVMSLEFIEARPRSWSGGIPSRVWLQTLDCVDVILLLVITQCSPRKSGVNEVHDRRRQRQRHTIPCAREGGHMKRNGKQLHPQVQRESRRRGWERRKEQRQKKSSES